MVRGEGIKGEGFWSAKCEHRQEEFVGETQGCLMIILRYIITLFNWIVLYRN